MESGAPSAGYMPAGLDEAEHAEVLQLLSEDLESLSDSLSAAWEAGDSALIRRLLHKTMGCSLQFHLHGLLASAQKAKRPAQPIHSDVHVVLEELKNARLELNKRISILKRLLH